MKRIRFRTVFRIVWAICGLGFFGWMAFNTQAHGVEPAVMQSDESVRVNDMDRVVGFSPTAQHARAGLVFYPGGLIDPLAYAPMARTLAETGFAVVIVKLPWRQAPLESHREELFEKTLKLIESYPDTLHWSVGGHSRGGALAALFAERHARVLDGLILIGTTHPKERDLSNLDLEVTKIYGSADGLASESEIKQYASNLPESTRWVRIEGGNHAQFGWYGSQLGDHRAAITREEQQARTVAAISSALNETISKIPK